MQEKNEIIKIKKVIIREINYYYSYSYYYHLIKIEIRTRTLKLERKPLLKIKL